MAAKKAAKSIDWKKVELVYEDDGRKVPAMLAKLSGPLAQARTAYSFFATELVHQDAASPGAVVVAPLLVPIAQAPQCKVAGSLLRLLGTLACEGDPLTLLSAQQHPVDPVFLAAARDCRPTALQLLTSHDEQARVGAALLLATIRDGREELARVLHDALAREKSPVVRATLLLALLVHTREKPDPRVYERALGAKGPVERLAGLVALAVLGPLPARVAKVARGLLDADDAKGFPWRNGNLTLLTIDALRFAAVRDGDPSLLLGLLDSPRAHLIIPAVAPALFPAAVKVGALDAAQRAFLDVVTRDASHFLLVQKLLVERGLPKVALELRRALGLAGEDPLDATHRFEGAERSFRELMELAAKDPAKRAAIAQTVTTGKTGDEVMGLAVQVRRAGLRGEDPDGSPAVDRVASAVLAACKDGPGLLKQLREFNFYAQVQDASGAIFLIEGLRVPIALELARRTKSGDEARFKELTASAFEWKWSAPMWNEVFLALDAGRRARYLALALLERTSHFFLYDGAFVPALLVTPSERLAGILREAVKQWKLRYAQERHGGGGHQGPDDFCDAKLDAKKLKTLAPKDHPRIDRLAGPTRAYVKVLRDAKLTKAADGLERDLEAFLAS